MTPEKVQAVSDLVEENSTPLSRVSKRKTKQAGVITHLRSLQIRRQGLFMKSNLAVSRATFYRHLRQEHSHAVFRKKPSDMCEYCFAERDIRMSIVKLFGSARIAVTSTNTYQQLLEKEKSAQPHHLLQ